MAGPVAPDALDPHWVELSSLVTRVGANRAEMSRLHAERAEMCAEALDLIARRVAQRQAAHPGREIGDSIPLREVLAELATALRVGERTVSGWLGDGAELVSTYRATLEALREGRIDERHASAIIDAGVALDGDVRAEYERRALDIADTATAPELRDTARIIAARLQPSIVDEGRRDALAQRQVKTYGLRDGLSRLLLDAPAALVQGVFERVTDMACALESAAPPDETEDSDDRTLDQRRADVLCDLLLTGAPALGAKSAAPPDETEDSDDRTLDQRRADVLCDLLLTGAPALGAKAGLGSIRATVNVTVPLLTLAGLDSRPAVLHGHGPIDVETVRVLAAAAPVWQRVMTHPVTEEPLRLDVYRPSGRLRRLLNARDRTCRWPGCRRPAARSEADHTRAWEEGGATCASNLAILCKGHHTLKHASAWTVRHLGGGSLEFTSPTRRRHRNDAPAVVEARGDVGLRPPPWRRLLDSQYDWSDPAPF
ncbi:HNH endonuclease signature motif containing protein [Microbacterium flavum]|uniref:DUF222 domain-containing protein n=1 Tax=Microbacterium flavum TaxID=415216 RepID=A0ABS5XW26_9MICO|nr:HNH endonuclease signature motif containing protein [Microbacterium flavum]MBT8798719.1 DUF222 domain-containing protein [Microbacterium flavum]